MLMKPVTVDNANRRNVNLPALKVLVAQTMAAAEPAVVALMKHALTVFALVPAPIRVTRSASNAVRCVVNRAVIVLKAIRAKPDFVCPTVAFLLVPAATLATVAVTHADVVMVKFATARINVWRAVTVPTYAAQLSAAKSAAWRAALTMVHVPPASFVIQVFVLMMACVSQTVAVMHVT